MGNNSSSTLSNTSNSANANANGSTSANGSARGVDRNNCNTKRETSQSKTNGGGIVHAHIGILRRGLTGTLGLSRSVLDKMCKPSGLYPTNTWDDRSIRRLIGDGKLAARLSGNDTILTGTEEECPICFLYFSQVNETSCCKGHLCSECYLQIRPMHEKKCPCPFCNSTQFSIKIATPKPVKTIEDQDQEQETVTKLEEPQFGSKLVRMRSESLTSSELSEDSCPSSALTLSTNERKKLEKEMKKQYNHPLARRMDMEAEQRREQHDQSYQRTNSDRNGRTRGILSRTSTRLSMSSRLSSRNRHSRSLRGFSTEETNAPRRNWNQLVQALEQNYGDEGRAQTLDDLVVLEAALLLNMEQQAARIRGRSEQTDDRDREDTGYAQVLNSFMSRRAAETPSQDDDDTDEEQETATTLRRIRRPRQGSRHWMSGMMNSEAGATATLLMRGVTEEAQLEMAIAASLRDTQLDQSNTSNTTNANDTDENNDNENSNEAEVNTNATTDSTESAPTNV